MASENNTAHIDVRYVAELARLALSEEEVTQYQQELDGVLQYMDKLNELDLADVEPTAHATPMINVWREDEPGESLSREEVIQNAPQSKDNMYIRVPPPITEEEES